MCLRLSYRWQCLSQNTSSKLQPLLLPPNVKWADRLEKARTWTTEVSLLWRRILTKEIVRRQQREGGVTGHTLWKTRHRCPRLVSRLKSYLSMPPEAIEMDDWWPRHLQGKLCLHEKIGLAAPKLTMGLLQAQKTGILQSWSRGCDYIGLKRQNLWGSQATRRQRDRGRDQWWRQTNAWSKICPDQGWVHLIIFH